MIRLLLLVVLSQYPGQELDRALQAYYNSINRVKYPKVESLKVDVDVTDPKQTFEVTIYRKRPTFFRQSIRTKSATIVQIYDGVKAWGLDYAGRKRELGDRQLRYLKSLAPIDPLLLSVSKSRMELKNPSSRSGYWQIIIEEDDEQNIFWVNKKTGLVDFTRREDKTLERTIDSEIMSYKTFDGFVYPILIHQKVKEGTKVTAFTYKVKEVEINPELPADFF